LRFVFFFSSINFLKLIISSLKELSFPLNFFNVSIGTPEGKTLLYNDNLESLHFCNEDIFKDPFSPFATISNVFFQLQYETSIKKSIFLKLKLIKAWSKDLFSNFFLFIKLICCISATPNIEKINELNNNLNFKWNLLLLVMEFKEKRERRF